MSVVSGIQGAKATEKAAETQLAGTREASGVTLEMYEQSRQDQMPWLTAGKEALGGLAGPEGMITQGPGDFSESEYYQQGLEEEERAIDRYMASRGLYASGKAGKALSENAMANMQRNRGNWVNEWIATKLNPTQSLAGVGQSTAANVGAQGMQTGYQVGSNIMSGAQAIAQGKINQANIISGTSANTANAIAAYYGNKAGSSTPAFNSPASANTGNYGPVQG